MNHYPKAEPFTRQCGIHQKSSEGCKDIIYAMDLSHSFKVSVHGTCRQVNRSAIGKSYTGNNLTKELISNAISNFQAAAELVGINLSSTEKLHQWISSYKTYWLKYLLFKFLWPLKTRLNANTK